MAKGTTYNNNSRFKPWIRTKYEISRDKEYAKEKKENEDAYYKKGEIRYSQQTYTRIESAVNVE